LPSGLPRTCCDEEITLTDAQQQLPAQLSKIVGSPNVMDGKKLDSVTTQFLKGARLGQGSALCIVTPNSLEECVDCVQAIVDANCTVLPQGSNTGLTGGSVPRDDNHRPTVVISMKKLDTIFPIDDGHRVVCLAGAGLATLSNSVKEWFPDRESHSILGSTFLNPTTAAGVAFGSGGTQLRKGSAYTDRAMYITVDQNKWGENVVKVVNTLGVEGIEDEDFPNNCGKAIKALDEYQHDVKQGFQRSMGKSSKSKHGKGNASDTGYAERVCKDTPEVARYNADTRGCDCNRSEGKVLILATVHDTFQKPDVSKTFWVSFSDLETALAFRREVCLENATDLPVSLEYMDRDSFDIIDRSGRVMANLIKFIGPTSSIVKQLWNIKLFIEGLPFDYAPLICDKLLHVVNPVFPAVLPSDVMKNGKAMDHHIAMSAGEFGNGELDRLLDRMQKFASKHGKDKIAIHECRNSSEENSLNAFRFVAATAFRTWCVGEGAQGISVDYALPKNAGDTPPLSTATPLKRMRYSHFGCNVVHEDLAYGPEVDVHAAKMELKKTVERSCGGKLPAEHGHGTEYHAPKEAQNRWKRMDPLNVMNPGVGGLPTTYKYKE